MVVEVSFNQDTRNLEDIFDHSAIREEDIIICNKTGTETKTKKVTEDRD